MNPVRSDFLKEQKVSRRDFVFLLYLDTFSFSGRTFFKVANSVNQLFCPTNFASLYLCVGSAHGSCTPPSKTWLPLSYAFVFHSSWLKKTPSSAFRSPSKQPVMYFIWHPAVC